MENQRTIKYNLVERLALQAQEAEVQGLTKLASHLTREIEEQSSRSDDDFYAYSSDQFYADVERHLWKIAVRAMDFYNITPDSSQVQNMIEHHASSIVEDLKNNFNVSHGIGAHEESVPGEIVAKMVFEVSE